MTFPIGSTVKWKDRYNRSSWRGKVTGHPMARMVEVNGQGAISVGLLELVEEPMPHVDDINDLVLMGMARDHAQQELAEMQAVVVQQCELIGQLQPDASEFKRLQELEDGFSALQDRVSDMLMVLVGSRTPTRETCRNWPPELYALAEELANYGG